MIELPSARTNTLEMMKLEFLIWTRCRAVCSPKVQSDGKMMTTQPAHGGSLVHRGVIRRRIPFPWYDRLVPLQCQVVAATGRGRIDVDGFAHVIPWRRVGEDVAAE